MKYGEPYDAPLTMEPVIANALETGLWPGGPATLAVAAGVTVAELEGSANDPDVCLKVVEVFLRAGEVDPNLPNYARKLEGNARFRANRDASE